MECCVPSDGRLLRVLLWAGAALVSIGAAFIYWPAGLIVAGLLLMRIVGAAEAQKAERRKQEERAAAAMAAAKARAEEQARKAESAARSSPTPAPVNPS